MDKDEYVCNLTEASLKKAQKELFEIPSDRLAAVSKLREWIENSTYLNFPTDTETMITYLRGAKYSQLRAHELIENTLTLKTRVPEWCLDVDTHEEKVLALIQEGYIIPLPKRDSNGRLIMLFRLGCADPKNKLHCIDNEMRIGQVIAYYNRKDENTQVNGQVFIFDYTGFTAKHLSRWSLDVIRKASKNWQDATPGRVKEFHIYNAGGFFEALMSLMRPFMKKKSLDRMRTHTNLESLYKCVPMDLLPEEYLPDEYEGPNVGSLKQLTANLKNAIMEPAFRSMVLDITSKKYYIDMSKKPSNDVPVQSFRKLNVD